MTETWQYDELMRMKKPSERVAFLCRKSVLSRRMPRRSRHISVRREPDTSQPREGDTLVTLTCDGTLPLEKRMDLLTYAFAKAIQGAILRVIIKWDIANGCLKFIVGEGANIPGPRGRVEVILDDVDQVEATAEPFLPAKGVIL